MIIEPLSKQQICDVYSECMIRDFAKDEIKPLKTILSLYDDGNYKCFGAFSQNRISAYAFIAKNDDAALLDYFAVAPSLRGKGLGSEFLTALTDLFSDRLPLIFEVERVSCAADKKDMAYRQKRVEFYLKNHALKTEVNTSVFGVDYSIMYFNTCGYLTDESVRIKLRDIYKMMLSAEKYENYVKI